jgi:hypothetical protein
MPRANKPWPARETQDIAREAVAIAPTSMDECRRINVRLLRKHQAYMIPYSADWMRAEMTIRNLQAQS